MQITEVYTYLIADFVFQKKIMYINTLASAKKANKAEPTLALKPRGDVTRDPKQGYQWP